MSELKEYFKDMDMQWDLEHFDEYSKEDKEYWKQAIGFKRWKAVKDVKAEILPVFRPFLKWLNKKLS